MISLDTLETVIFEASDDHVATITLNRPAVMNCLQSPHGQRIRFSLVAYPRDRCHPCHRASRRTRPGVLHRRRPERPLLSGPTAQYLGPAPIRARNYHQNTNKCWKPVIAAVHGLCGGGAFYWLNESDIIICAADAQFFEPHVTYGLTAACEPIGLNYRLMLGDVLRMALLGNDERICAETALRIGNGQRNHRAGRALDPRS